MKDTHNVSMAHIAEMTNIPYREVYNLYRLNLSKIKPGPTSDEYQELTRLTKGILLKYEKK